MRYECIFSVTGVLPLLGDTSEMTPLEKEAALIERFEEADCGEAYNLDGEAIMDCDWFRVYASYSTEVEANSEDEARELAEYEFQEADFGELCDIDGELNGITAQEKSKTNSRKAGTITTENGGIAMNNHEKTLEDLEQELVRKIEDEYNDYVAAVSKLPVERIINEKSLETARKQEIMDRLCGGGVSDWDLDEDQIERLLARNNLLNDLYFAYAPSQETYDLEADDFQSCIDYVARDTTIRERDIERD